MSDKNITSEMRENENLIRIRDAHNSRWLKKELIRLIELVNLYGENWEQISQTLKTRTAKECREQFSKINLEKKKGNWSQQEDDLLLGWVRYNGPRDWVRCSKKIPGRSGKQCRERWKNSLDPEVKKGNWTIQEQFIIFEMMRNDFHSWTAIAARLNGRTENSIKNYFYSSIRRLRHNKLWSFLISYFFNEEERIRSKLYKNYFCFLLFN